MIVAQLFQYVKEKAAQTSTRCDPQGLVAVAPVLRRHPGTLHGRDDFSGVLVELCAGPGQFDRSGRAMEQLHTELALQSPYLLTDGGLDDVRLLRSTAKVRV